MSLLVSCSHQIATWGKGLMSSLQYSCDGLRWVCCATNKIWKKPLLWMFTKVFNKVYSKDHCSIIVFTFDSHHERWGIIISNIPSGTSLNFVVVDSMLRRKVYILWNCVSVVSVKMSITYLYSLICYSYIFNYNIHSFVERNQLYKEIVVEIILSILETIHSTFDFTNSMLMSLLMLAL